MPRSSSRARPTRKTLGLRNIGPKSEQWLLDVGIVSIADLRRVGAPAVYATIVRQGIAPATRNLLYALEAAVRDLDWRELPDSVKRQAASEADDLLKG